jgi:hypothetical protein
MTRPPSPNRPASPNRSAAPRHPLYDYILATPNLVAFWPLDDAAGSTTGRDASGNGHAVSWSGGASPGAVGFDGKTSTIFDGTGMGTIPYAAAFTPAADCSFEAWVQFNQELPNMWGIGALNFTVFCQDQQAGSTPPYGLWWTLAALSNEVYYLRAYGQTADTQPGLWTVSPFANGVKGKWHHLAANYRVGGTTQFYLDGTPTTWCGVAAAPVIARTSDLRIGGCTATSIPPGSIANFIGSIQYVAFYDTLLTEAQVIQRYTLGSSIQSLGGVNYANLLAAAQEVNNIYRMNDASGSLLAIDDARGQHGIHSAVTAGVDGLIGPAAQYNGSTSYTYPQYGYQGALVPTSLTLDAWVNPTALDGTTAAILSRGDEAAQTLNYRIAKNSGDGRVSVVVKLNATTYSYLTTNPLIVNDWNHVGVVLQGGQSPIVVLNGVQEVLSSGTTIPLVTLQLAGTNDLVRVGASENTPANFFPGRIQQLSVAAAASSAGNLIRRHTVGLIASGRIAS